MGRKLTTLDFGGDLDSLLAHCLELADQSGQDLAAVYIATAIDTLAKGADAKAALGRRKGRSPDSKSGGRPTA